MSSPLIVSIPVWLVIIAGCVWLAVKSRSRFWRVLGLILAVIFLMFLAGGTYFWMVFMHPIRVPPEQQEAAVKSFKEFVKVWCEDDWDKVWEMMSSLGKMEHERTKYLKVLRILKNKQFPDGISPADFQDIRVCTLRPYLLRIVFVNLIIGGRKEYTEKDLSTVARELQRQGVLCLAYKINRTDFDYSTTAGTYVNLIVHEDGAWRPTSIPGDILGDDDEFGLLDALECQ